LELGCGYWGRNLRALKEQFPSAQFTGVDLSIDQSTQDLELIQADLSDWKPARKYDVVLSLAVLEHLADPKKHFELLAQSLKPGGFAGITSPTPQSHIVLSTLGSLGIFDRDEIRDHKVYYTETGLRLLASEAALNVENYRPLSFGLNQWILLRKV
jgi:trans-aconitate methyltransferase